MHTAAKDGAVAKEATAPRRVWLRRLALSAALCVAVALAAGLGKGLRRGGASMPLLNPVVNDAFVTLVRVPIPRLTVV